jgi:hypothetical protein
MADIDPVEAMRFLTEDYLCSIGEHIEPGQMADVFYRVNLLRRAAKDAVYTMLEMEQADKTVASVRFLP